MSILTRRSVLQMTAGAVASVSLPNEAIAAAADPSGWRPKVVTSTQIIEKPQRLFIKNHRTGDVFNDVVKHGSLIFDDAYAELDHLMRDWRRDEVIPMDRALIDLLLAVQSEVGHAEPITLISGYRSKSTNDMLRRRIRKVAKNSYHIKGMAIDFRVEGVRTSTLNKVALSKKSGGVGYYRSRGFIHLDTGPIRQWRG